jgi:hypothetical protein
VSGNRNKVFFRPFLDLAFLDLAFLHPLDHIPEKLVFTKSVFDPDVEFSITARKLTHSAAPSPALLDGV